MFTSKNEYRRADIRALRQGIVDCLCGLCHTAKKTFRKTIQNVFVRITTNF